MTPSRLVLLTGATGYVGGRLLRRLEQSGAQVRCLARDPERLRHRTGEFRVRGARDGSATAAREVAVSESTVIEIGAPDVVSYAEPMKEYARQLGLRRVFVPVPVLTPRLSSLWLGLVTPLCARVGRKLIGSLRNETVVRDRSLAREPFPEIEPRGVREAIARAVAVFRGMLRGIARKAHRMARDTPGGTSPEALAAS